MHMIRDDEVRPVTRTRPGSPHLGAMVIWCPFCDHSFQAGPPGCPATTCSAAFYEEPEALALVIAGVPPDAGEGKEGAEPIDWSNPESVTEAPAASVSVGEPETASVVTSLPFEPGEYTVAGVKEQLGGLTTAELYLVAGAEANSENRRGVTKAIDAEMEARSE